MPAPPLDRRKIGAAGVVEDDVWIGANTVISEGAILREGAIIDACSFVNKEIESYGIYVGNPFNKIGEKK